MNDDWSMGTSLILAIVITLIVTISVVCGLLFLAGEFDQRYTETIVIKDVYDLGSGEYSIISANNTEYLTYQSYIYFFALQNIGNEVEIIYTANDKECKIREMRLARSNQVHRCNVTTCKGELV
jgi:hypothetical protein